MSTPEKPSADRSDPEVPHKSFGNIDEHHWTRARADANQEAIDYYRERSHAPGVAEGGGPRNFYCMSCDGVIPIELEGEPCPHCGTKSEGEARRYFNWVEIDRPPTSDARAVLPWLLLALAVLVGSVWLLWRLIT